MAPYSLYSALLLTRAHGTLGCHLELGSDWLVLGPPIRVTHQFDGEREGRRWMEKQEQREHWELLFQTLWCNNNKHPYEKVICTVNIWLTFLSLAFFLSPYLAGACCSHQWSMLGLAEWSRRGHHHSEWLHHRAPTQLCWWDQNHGISHGHFSTAPLAYHALTIHIASIFHMQTKMEEMGIWRETIRHHTCFMYSK